MNAEGPQSVGNTNPRVQIASSTAGEEPIAPAANSSPGDAVVVKPFSWQLAAVLTVAVLGLGFIGFALTNYAPSNASWYWVVVLPAFAAMGIWQTWNSVREGGKTNWQLVRRQIYHWLVLFVALKIMFVLIYSGNLDREDAGLISLLLTAVTCTLVGVNFDWIFIPIGVLLGMGVLLVSCFREYLWLVLLGTGLAIVLLLTLQRFARR